MDISDFNITIVGLGLLGGSMAMALKELKPRNLWAVDNDESAIEFAEKSSIISKGYINSKIPLEDSDIVIICLYPNQIVKYIKGNMNFFKKGAIITDIAGIKSGIVKEINDIKGKNFEFISGHPMAGNEHKGIRYSNKEMFKNANYIITPSGDNKEENIE
ncbi:MAG: prephenate dehydrogenase/arogenate dehydrogenase family protein, partial [Proteocatella sp.]